MPSKPLTAEGAEECHRAGEEEQEVFAISAVALAIFAVQLLFRECGQMTESMSRI